MDKYIGKKIDDRYEIDELIGIGGMANVYKAHDHLMEREVAIKILRDEHLSDEDLLRRFKNESKAISMFSHPNIVKIYNVSFEHEVQCIVMEYIDGITLKEYIDRQKILHWKDVVYFSVQILRALQHAHDKGIVHRDVKPQNIMLLIDGTIKVTDFGIARFARSEEKTVTDKAMGSVHYISPEQARGEYTDDKTDIYSVGIMMYEMLTGQLPFDAENAVSVALKQIEVEPKRLKDINPDVPQGLEDIVLRAMQKNAENRYQSAAELLKDLYEFQKNPDIVFGHIGIPIEKSKIEETSSNTLQNSEKRKPTKPKKKKILTESAYTDKVLTKSPVLSVLFGVALAFILTTVIFIVGMFWIVNPLEKTDDVVVPNLIGVQYEELSQYQDFRFEIVTPEYSAKYDRGQIIKQSPNEGKTVKTGSTIQITVSLGPDLVKIPNFQNYDLNIVAKHLRQLGVNYTVVEAYDDTIPDGKIIKTEPAASEEVTEGSKIVLYLSRGPQVKIINMPDLSGLTLAGARTYLLSYGLKAGVVTEEISSELKGTVIKQDPAPGTPVELGSYVNLTLAKTADSANKVDIRVVLPQGNGIVAIQAKNGDELLWAEAVDLSATRVWSPSLEGEGIALISILIEGNPYRDYMINFNAGEYVMVKEYPYGDESSSESSMEESSSESSWESSAEESSESSTESSEPSESSAVDVPSEESGEESQINSQESGEEE